MMKKISLITPSIGRPFLDRVLCAIDEINYPNLEHIIVLSGQEYDITRYFVPLVEKGKIIIASRNSLTPAQAKNKGLSIATGDYITFIDDDDIPYQTKFVDLSHYLDENPNCDAVFGNYDTYSPKGEIICRGFGLAPFTPTLNSLLKNNYIGSGAIMLRNIGTFRFDEKKFFGEDYHAWLKYFGEGNRVDYYPITVYGWTQGSEKGFSFRLKPEEWKRDEAEIKKEIIDDYMGGQLETD